MIQRFIGASLGAAVTFGLLWFNSADANAWATAAILGAIVSLLWPIAAGVFLGLRSRRRNQQIQQEVSRQVAAQTNRPPE